MLVVHINVDAKRAAAFEKRSREIVEKNGWPSGISQIVEDPYRDLYNSVAKVLQELRKDYPNVHLDMYIGALRTRFPYSLLHVSTDRLLRDILEQDDDVSLTVKQVYIDELPLPPDFKVTFEHATDEHHESTTHAK
jgi:hypothetical protein